MPGLAFQEKRSVLLASMDAAHEAFYRSAVFGGPSLHFHLRALQAAREHDPATFIESAYAMLASWGMHRMGPGGSKMREFEEFASSIKSAWPIVLKLQNLRPDQLNCTHWADLQQVFFEIKVMQSKTWLVGTSKVMAHALPMLVPPVDRNYTLKFLYGNTNIRNDLAAEWRRLRTILEDFFYPLLLEPSFANKAGAWLRDSQRFKWDTSSLKLLDNLIVGSQKL